MPPPSHGTRRYGRGGLACDGGLARGAGCDRRWIARGSPQRMAFQARANVTSQKRMAPTPHRMAPEVALS